MSPSRRTRATAPLRLAALAAFLALAGCGVLPKNEPIALYRPEPRLLVDPAWPKADWQLQIARPGADAVADSARILVRPRAGELQVYKGAAWTQPAPDIVHDTMMRAFIDSGRFAGVARRGEGVSPRYELLLDLRRFESDYAGGSTPTVRIAVGARLVHNIDNRIVASRVFEADVAADGTAVAHINRAFEQGLGEVSTQMIGWVLAEGGRSADRSRY
ncbi:MAG: membrane integrity-associated transporter subunit PqiC [Lysobacter sp.]|nr:membrane integrity-associated transporter subunit PqiC [Lysobacter sp.]